MMELARKAREGHKHSVAKLVSLFENTRDDAAPKRAEAMRALDALGAEHGGSILGITGTPGAGKSTLSGALVLALRELRPTLRIAVVAIDPSSHISGGALLGDRTRVRFGAKDPGLYFRSQASATALGGLAPSTFQVCRLLHRLYDLVLVETVGIGQNEIDVRLLADRVFLVLQPLGGDEVQFLKAGIMEVPDEIILNKCDEKDAAKRSYRALRASMSLARPFDGDSLPIHRVSAKTGMGITRLAERFGEAIDARGVQSLAPREARFFERWVEDECGRRGQVALRDAFAGAASFIEANGGFDDAQAAFVKAYAPRVG